MLKTYGKVLVLSLAVLISIGCSNEQAKKAQKTEQVEKVVPVVVNTVEKGNISEFISLSGEIQPTEEVRVIPKNGGRVAQVTVEVGNKVQKGQVIARLESREIELQINQAEVALSNAKANLLQIKKGARSQEVEQVKLAVEQARVSYENAQKNYQRMKELLAKEVISRQQFEGSEMQYNIAKAQFNSAKERLALTQVGATDETIMMAQGQVKQAEIALQNARIMLENTYIKSPISGVVAERSINPGEMASIATPAFKVVNIENVYAQINVSESVINKLRLNQSVDIKVAAASDDLFTGSIVRISPVQDQRTKAYPIQIRIANPKMVLRPGMFGEVALKLKEHKDIIVVPLDAVLDNNGRKVVFTVENRRAVKKDIEIGIVNKEIVEVVTGLNAGEKLVVVGEESLEQGKLVKVSGQEEAK